MIDRSEAAKRRDRLVPVSDRLKTHPFWDGSHFRLSFLYGGGVTRGEVEDYLAIKARCSDLTTRELVWCDLWAEALKVGV